MTVSISQAAWDAMVERLADRDARIAELEKVEESMRQVIDYCTYVQANSTIAREVLKIVKDCGL